MKDEGFRVGNLRLYRYEGGIMFFELTVSLDMRRNGAVWYHVLFSDSFGTLRLDYFQPSEMYGKVLVR
jgi:hypothetical protein